MPPLLYIFPKLISHKFASLWILIVKFRSGRMCILDCTENALNCLYNTEFMPFVVAIAAPPLEEVPLLQTN